MRVKWERKLFVWTALSLLFVLMLDSKTFATTEAKLLASDGAEGDFFGRSVSASANLALVGAFHDDDKGTDSGSAYVFKIAETSTLKKAMPWIPLLLLEG
jgi:hypothetical protein